MPYPEVITEINTYIVTNGNEEITAAVLNPILRDITNFSNDTIGNLTDLTTTVTSNIVAAINSLKSDVTEIVNNGVQLYQGTANPNVTSPSSSVTYADFYMQVDISNNPVQLWQFTGTEWSTQSSVYSKAEVDLMVANIYAAIAALPSTTQLLMIDYDITSDGVDSFFIPTGRTAKQVFLDKQLLFKSTTNNIGRTDLWTQTGDVVTLTTPTEANNYIQIFYQ